jgi:hypothetical protein
MHMKRNTMRFYAQVTIVGVLASVGVIALCGEPNEDANFLLTVIGQFVWCFAWCGAAWSLGRKWKIGRKLNALNF